MLLTDILKQHAKELAGAYAGEIKVHPAAQREIALLLERVLLARARGEAAPIVETRLRTEIATLAASAAHDQATREAWSQILEGLLAVAEFLARLVGIAAGVYLGHWGGRGAE